MANDRKYIGLIPAAGYATRLADLTCSKEIFPIRYKNHKQQNIEFPVCKMLLDAYKNSGIKDICIISREDKTDVAKALGNGEQFDVSLSHLYTQKTTGVAYTLDKAYAFVQDSHIALGFADIIFKPVNAFSKLISKQQSSHADVVLGLFPAEKPSKMDMVEFDDSNHIQAIHIKPKKTTLQWTWILAVWKPTFTEFMHQTLTGKLKQAEHDAEMHVGRVFQLALDAGLQFDTVMFNDGKLIDIGTPDDLNNVANRLKNENWF